jgi:hypothetical protein
MYLKQIADAIATGVNDVTLSSSGANYARTKNFINEFYRLNFLPLREWEFLRREGTLTQVAEYTVGQATFTNGSTLVSGLGTSWTSSMIDRYIMVNGERHYRITAVANSTNLTIESPYEGSTITAQYTIAQFRYKLPRWVDYPVRIYSMKPEIYSAGMPYKLRQFMLRPSERLIAMPPYVSGPRVRSLYTTGTISATFGTKMLIGFSTNWQSSGIEQHDNIQIGNSSYSVDSINSDTSITIFGNIIETVVTSPYTAVLDRWTLDFNYYSVEARTLYLTAATMVRELCNDFDIPVLPDNWHYILVLGGKIKAKQHNGDDVSQELSELGSVLKSLVSLNSRNQDREEALFR